jgi:hypothetical protein
MHNHQTRPEASLRRVAVISSGDGDAEHFLITLSQAGYLGEVMIFPTLAVARESLTGTGTVDLFVIDLESDELVEHEVAALVNAHRRGESAPVVFLSGADRAAIPTVPLPTSTPVLRKPLDVADVAELALSVAGDSPDRRRDLRIDLRDERRGDGADGTPSPSPLSD